MCIFKHDQQAVPSMMLALRGFLLILVSRAFLAPALEILVTKGGKFSEACQ